MHQPSLTVSVPQRCRHDVDEQERPVDIELEGVLDCLGDGLFVEDRSGAIVWANEAAARMFGQESPAKLVGHGLAELQELTDEESHPLDCAQLPGALLLRGRSLPAPLLVRLRDRTSGSVRWASVSANPIHTPDGPSLLAATVWRDVTDERRREESARYLARATDILSQSLDYAATVNRLGRVLVPQLADWFCVDVLEEGKLQCIAVEHADPSMVPLTRQLHALLPSGLDDEAGIGAVVRTGHSELVSDMDEAMIQAYAGGHERRAELLRILAPRSMLVVPLKARDQTFGAMKLLASEGRRRYDEHDMATAEEVGRRVGIAIENARAYRDAREAIRLRDEFLAIASHELRTPLAALKLQLQTVNLALHGGQVASDPAAWAKRMARTLGDADRLQEVIERLLDVSHISSQRLLLRCEKTSLTDVWRSVIERHRAEAERAGSVVSLTATGDTVGEWDRARIDQVLTSLLGNALKYGQGKPIDVSIEGDSAVVKTNIHDQGMGIDLSAQSRLFGRFERAVSVRNYGGFGLGLWVVRQLVEAHGGMVGFESQPGQGSTFWVELPSSPAST